MNIDEDDYEVTSSEDESMSSEESDIRDFSRNNAHYVIKNNKPLPQQQQVKPVVAKAVAGKALFKGRGVLPAGKEECKQCKEMSEDMFLCKKDTNHLRCENCKLLFPERN